ncbi:hypothetical protein, partial [Klebsiella pneumoniae]|uniref:hypothetical protein n=1 Tax=Klebsiella pneumoniae TaxID=573 RepID=UPI001BE0CE79
GSKIRLFPKKWSQILFKIKLFFVVFLFPKNKVATLSFLQNTYLFRKPNLEWIIEKDKCG